MPNRNHGLFSEGAGLQPSAQVVPRDSALFRNRRERARQTASNRTAISSRCSKHSRSQTALTITRRCCLGTSPLPQTDAQPVALLKTRGLLRAYDQTADVIA